MIQAINPNDETQKTARREQLTALFGKFPIQGIDFKRQLLEYSQGIVLFKGKEYMSGGIIFMKPSPPTRPSKNPLPNKLVVTFQRKTHATTLNRSAGEEGYTTTEVNLSSTTFQIINLSEIVGVEFTQIICDDPECANCIKKREKGEGWPYFFKIVSMPGETTFTVDSFGECAQLAQDIMAATGRSR